jgi:hypothetical protein
VTKQLSLSLSIHLLTAGTHGNLDMLRSVFSFPLRQIETGEDKVRVVQEPGPANVVAFGNGANDAGMLHLAPPGIAVLGEEGAVITAGFYSGPEVAQLLREAGFAQAQIELGPEQKPFREIAVTATYTPCTIIRLVLAARWRMPLMAEYSGELYQAWACSTLGNSMTTIRFVGHSPSNVSGWPPRTRNFPPYCSTVAGV